MNGVLKRQMMILLFVGTQISSSSILLGIVSGIDLSEFDNNKYLNLYFYFLVLGNRLLILHVEMAVG